MQALSIYILIRLDEGEKDYNNFDYLLVKTVAVSQNQAFPSYQLLYNFEIQVIAQQFNRIDNTCHNDCALCNKGLETSWTEWIFKESRRRLGFDLSPSDSKDTDKSNHRLGVIYRVFNMLIYFEPGAMCDMPTDLILAPLPARKQLWEAGDEFAWRAESQREPGIQVSFGLAADGNIVKLDESRFSCSDVWLLHHSSDSRTPSRSTASWEEWCTGADGLGALVMLAASLIV
jgi:hypothetical protein